MSVPAFAWALEQGKLFKLPTPGRMVLIYLANKANGELFCWPGQDLIAEFTGLTPRSIRIWTDRLERLGLIRQSWRGKVREYHILRPVNGEDNSPNGNDVPVNNSPTPEPRSHEYRNHVPMSDPVTGIRRTSHGNLTTKTPERDSAETTIETRRETKTREGARQEGDFSFSGKVGKEAGTRPPEPERELTPAEVEARRREHAEAMASMPGPMAEAISQLGASMRGVAWGPGRRPMLSAEAQQEVLAPRKVKPAPVSAEQLALLRQRAGIAPPRELVPA